MTELSVLRSFMALFVDLISSDNIFNASLILALEMGVVADMVLYLVLLSWIRTAWCFTYFVEFSLNPFYLFCQSRNLKPMLLPQFLYFDERVFNLLLSFHDFGLQDWIVVSFNRKKLCFFINHLSSKLLLWLDSLGFCYLKFERVHLIWEGWIFSLKFINQLGLFILLLGIEQCFKKLDFPFLSEFLWGSFKSELIQRYNSI